jgi:hypothetical protein
MTRARARALAQALLLHQDDVPGFAATKDQGSDRPPTPSDAAVDRCSGAVPTTRALVNADSENFLADTDLGVQGVASNVQVMPSRRLATRDMASIDKIEGCLRRYPQAALVPTRSGPARIRSVAVLPVRAPGTNGGNGLRMAMTMDVHGVTLEVYLDALGFVIGQTEVNLATWGVGRPFPAAGEHQLYSLLLRRGIEYLGGV